MALIKCKECGKEISDTSKKCIHCGAKIKKEKSKNSSKIKKKLILILLGATLIIGSIITISFLVKSNVEQTNLRDETKNQVEIITEYINIREKPNITSDILGKVHQGEIYDVLSENTESKYKWIEIETSNGIRGYISGIDDYVKKLYIENDITLEEPTIDTPIIDSSDEPNNENTDINDKPNNNQEPTTNNNNNDDTNNNNNSDNNEDDYEPQLKACLKTCDDGYILKNEDSVDCYCEKIPVEKTAKEKLIEVMKNNGYTCTSVQCTKITYDYSGNSLVYSDTFAINFVYKKASFVYAHFNSSDRGKAEIYYDTNSALSEYYGPGANSSSYINTCSQIFPSLICDNTSTKPINQAIDKFNNLLSEANITIEDLKNSK